MFFIKVEADEYINISNESFVTLYFVYSVTLNIGELVEFIIEHVAFNNCPKVT